MASVGSFGFGVFWDFLLLKEEKNSGVIIVAAFSRPHSASFADREINRTKIFIPTELSHQRKIYTWKFLLSRSSVKLAKQYFIEDQEFLSEKERPSLR